jgi:hypothetical protein
MGRSYEKQLQDLNREMRDDLLEIAGMLAATRTSWCEDNAPQSQRLLGCFADSFTFPDDVSDGRRFLVAA